MKTLFDLGRAGPQSHGDPSADMSDLSDVDQPQRLLDDATADRALRQALDHARSVGGRGGLRRLRSYSCQIAAVEAELVAEFVTDDGDTRAAERALADGKTSKREQRRRATRAKAVAKNKALADKLGCGELSEEQVDVIADASAKSDGDAATDTDLIDKVAAAPPEQGRSIADDYLADRASADGVQTEHDRQRRLRRASKYNSKRDGLDTIAIAGDGVAAKAMWDVIQQRADALYKEDGDRDLALDKHPRTNDQRKFDAAYELICGTKLDRTGRPTANPTNQDPAEPGQGAGKRGRSCSKRHTPPAAKTRSARPRIVISLTVDKLTGKDPAAVAIQHGLGLIPDTVLADYAADADIMAALFDRDGQPLWLGRLHRYASATQMIALILRDKHCVLCGADHTRCQAHHTMPWHAPGQGRTDLDDLVLLCGPCHTRLHAEEHTIYQDHSRTWRTRPATPDELSPPTPATSRSRVLLE